MKRKSNLYDGMLSYSNINFVFNKVKNNCHNKKRVYEFLMYKNCNLLDILEKLRRNSYSFSNYSIFLIQEKKYRVIMSENIWDKIVNQLVSYFIILPSSDNLIDTNVATRKNKGASYGYDLLNSYINKIGYNKRVYVLKIDIKKYFYNIDHDILYGLLEKRIKDKKALEILREIISLTDRPYVNKRIDYLINKEIARVRNLNISENEKSAKITQLRNIPRYKKGCGLSIGCLSNQLLAILYLNEVDHYIKEDLGHKYYIRYMDDLYVLDTDLDKLKLSFNLIEEKLKEYKLVINDKSGIYRLDQGVCFLGYMYELKNNKLNVKYASETVRKIDRKLEKLYVSDFDLFYRSVNSYKGYFIRGNTRLKEGKYKRFILKNRYDKYWLIKSRYSDYIVFIKYKNLYYTYGEDLKFIKRKFKLKRNGISFKRLKRLKEKYVLLEGNRISVFGTSG